MPVLSALLPLLLPVLVTGQVELPGPCPEPPLMKDFDPNQYDNKWYVAQVYAPKNSPTLKCPRSIYTIYRGSDEISFTNKETHNHQEKSVDGKLVPEPGSKGSYLIRMDEKCPGRWALRQRRQAKYKILHTDYKTHSLVWDCYNTDTTPVRSVQFLRVLVRRALACPDTSSTCWKDIEPQIERLNLSTDHLRNTLLVSASSHESCYVTLGVKRGTRRSINVDPTAEYCKSFLENTTYR